MLIIKEEKGRKDGDIFVQLTRNRGLNVSDCDRISYWCDKPHLTYFIRDISSVFTYKELKGIFNDILRSREPEEPFEPKDGDIIVMRTPKGQFIGILKGKVSIGDEGFPIYVGLNRSRELRYDTSFGYHKVDILKLATEEEKQLLFDELKEKGKRWNPEKKRIEDIPEEPKIGDYVIAWRDYRTAAVIGIYNGRDKEQDAFLVDGTCLLQKNVVKWNGTLEHLEKVVKGEV